jgi:hypothetical protein
MSSALVYPRLEPGVFTCPCGARTTDPVSICSGLCGICRRYTGLCQVGREPLLLPPDGIPVPDSWKRECPALGTYWWHIKVPGGPGPGWKAIHPLLCSPHHREALHLPWIDGIPIAPLDEAEVADGLGIAAAALAAAGYPDTAAAVTARAGLLVSALSSERG